jgi:hypothetical protein
MASSIRKCARPCRLRGLRDQLPAAHARELHAGRGPRSPCGAGAGLRRSDGAPLPRLLLNQVLKDAEVPASQADPHDDRSGIHENKTTDQIVRELRGTKANQYQDGLLEVDRRQHRRSSARPCPTRRAWRKDEVAEANADIIEKVNGRLPWTCARRRSAASGTARCTRWTTSRSGTTCPGSAALASALELPQRAGLRHEGLRGAGLDLSGGHDPRGNPREHGWPGAEGRELRGLARRSNRRPARTKFWAPPGVS